MRPCRDTAAKPLIAVVDDNESFLRSVRRLLCSAGYAVMTHRSAREFLKALPEASPGCLVLDVHMPEMTGLELQDHLIARGVCLPTVFVTAQDTPRTREYAQRRASVELLLKPFDKQALLNAIAKVMGDQSLTPPAG